MLYIGILLLVAWLALRLAFGIVSGAVHVLIVLAVVAVVWHFIKRGAGAARSRL
jgi:hypothetical protein